MFFRSILLTSTTLGLLGIGLAFLQFRRSRVWFWLMLGSGASLCVPMGHYLLVLLLSRLGLFGGYQGLTNTIMPVAQFHTWTRWIAYALLFFGVWDLRLDRSEPSLAGATLPAHPSTSLDSPESSSAESEPRGGP